MSYPFLPSDVFVPATSDSPLNPLVSVWLKSSIVNISAVAPVVPLINGWYLQLAQRWNPTPSSIPLYYTALDASWRHGGGLAMFRGSLPLFCSIPIATGFSLWTTMNCMMFTSNIERMNSALNVAGSIVAGEALVSIFRYLHITRATLSSHESLSETTRAGLQGMRFMRGFPSILAASSIAQIAPHFLSFYGLNSDPLTAIPGYIGLSLASYALFERGFGSIMAMEAERLKLVGDEISRKALHTWSRPRRFGAFSLGLASMVAIRMIVSSLLGHLSAKHGLIPF